jgi:hypothetical protein
MKKTSYITLIFISVLLITINSSAQNTIDKNVEVDGLSIVKSDTLEKFHSPKKAGYMSAILPGLGQAYNKKYWKLPIIYGGFAALTYYIIDNNTNYIKYRDAYIARTDEDPTNDDILPQYTTDNLRIIKNNYWKNRDLSIILTVTLYILNIFDAIADAHLYYYDISDDLSLRIDPVVIPAYNIGQTSVNGIGVSLNF